jgi:uncharacterized protein (TIGR02145 family)
MEDSMRGLGQWGRVAVLAAIVLGAVGAQTPGQTEKPKIALYIANDALTPDEKSFLTSKLLKPFTLSGLYSVIDRSDIFTQKAATERIKQRDGSVNEKEIYKIGKEAGAKYICMVDLRKAFGRWNIAARIVDVVTAEIYLFQGETDITGELDNADFSGAAKTIFEQIHAKNTGGGSAVSVARNQREQTPATAPALVSAQTTQQSGGGVSGTFTDSRDGKKYKTVVIGGKKWMAENLNYQPQSGKSWCYKKDEAYCKEYGRLYNWETAKTVCPAGFHLPSRSEWNDLAAPAGGKDAAGKKLKARNGWDDNGNGTDDYGFSALPGGYRYYDVYNKAGNSGNWWTSMDYGNGYAYRRGMYHNKDIMDEDGGLKGNSFSVRCVADN